MISRRSWLWLVRVGVLETIFVSSLFFFFFVNFGEVLVFVVVIMVGFGVLFVVI